MPGPMSLARHDWFTVGGRYVETPSGTFMVDQAYIERYEPETIAGPPVVMFHGGVQTSSNFISTADGRPGWVARFLAAGHPVLLFEQPERGRSGHRVDGTRAEPLLRYPAEQIERMFTASHTANRWPQAARHTGWPGSGTRGDPVFDAFYGSQVQMLADRGAIEALAAAAGVALLDAIGEAVLLTHSQSGPFGWLIADQRPDLVKGILAVEPNGPPFRNVDFIGEPDWFTWGESLARPYGITREPIAFDPPLASPDELAPALAEEPPADPELVHGLVPTGEQRRLPNLAGIPILIVTAEASYHAAYDHLTSEFLTWAGVDHDFVRLADRGLAGGGHMVMLEKDSDAAADLMIEWLGARLAAH